jgi:predicted O-linked N-acetylglucosamine transferase (SPINDLY family)
MVSWHPDILPFLAVEDYDSVIEYYENLLEQQPDDLDHYGHLGLAYLLNDDEESAQTTWLIMITQADEEKLGQIITELTTMLHQEAERQSHCKNLSKCWLIRSHIKEINALDFNNILDLTLLEIQLDVFIPERLEKINIDEIIQQQNYKETNVEKIFKVIQAVLRYPTSETIEFAKSCTRLCVISSSNLAEQLISHLINLAKDINTEHKLPLLGAELLQFCVELDADNREALQNLILLYLDGEQYKNAIETATHFIKYCHTDEEQFFGNSLLLKSMLMAGAWRAIPTIAKRHEALLEKLITAQPLLSLNNIKFLVVYAGYLFYLQDHFEKNRFLQNEAAKLFYKNIITNTEAKLPLYNSHRPRSQARLKIGYIAHTLRTHSVGWLSRWLFQQINRDEFHISIYQFVVDPEDSFFKDWFLPKVDFAHFSKDDIPAIAEKICDDEIDILIDLDSITLDHTVAVMSLKPAPVQATWLGWDASGLPSIDYYIADPYVLPLEADQHYSERILRLPQTYIAVDGFEIDIPTLRRRDLGISGDSVIYYSAQAGMKRHPETIQLQLEILKEVPESYLLIKGLADEVLLQEMFLDLATDIGIPAKRLKFLPLVSTEMAHRANLGIADVVLDTFPYNGATTTLETLWMGIPLVTRVGKQFAARNSYAFLMNVGVIEGIAWTAEEYVEWGVRFGKDPQLRLDVAWKLRQSRKNSPLWNTKQFTRHMEDAYRFMWQNYLEKHSD